MKKQAILSGLLVGCMGALSAVAAPLAQKSVNELLGVRNGAVFNSYAVSPKSVAARNVSQKA